jgi:hydroxymethylpyrimidine pyrophosphatase-like HAD family hydrolase
MVEAAGLGVAVDSGMQELIDVADRVIGSHDSDAIADLVAELF